MKSNSTTVPFRVEVCVSYAAAPWCANIGLAKRKPITAAHKITVSLRVMLFLPRAYESGQLLPESLCRDKLLNPCPRRDFTRIEVSLRVRGGHVQHVKLAWQMSGM